MLTGVSWSSPDHTQGTDCLWHVYVFTVVGVVVLGWGWDCDTGWEGTSAPVFSPHQIWSDHSRIVCGSVYVWFFHTSSPAPASPASSSHRGWIERERERKNANVIFNVVLVLDKLTSACSKCSGGFTCLISRSCPQCDALWLTVRREEYHC